MSLKAQGNGDSGWWVFFHPKHQEELELPEILQILTEHIPGLFSEQNLNTNEFLNENQTIYMNTPKSQGL